MPAQLRATGDGWQCPQHPAYAPTGLTVKHAQNSLAKHNREEHAHSERNAYVDAMMADIIDSDLIDAHRSVAHAVARHLVAKGWVLPPF